MATIASKCKLNAKSIKDKYSALKEVEDGKTKSQVATKYGTPKPVHNGLHVVIHLSPLVRLMYFFHIP